MKEKQCIIVAGPTAIGKTAEAIRLAKLHNTSIISADSRQCYRELRIGVARPTEDELKEVKHYFIANHSITENVSAATFAKEASAYLDEIFKDHDVAIVCGGTGLYIKALVEGLDEIPPTPDEIRAEVIQLYKEKGIDALRNRLLELDPSFAGRGDIQNPQRMMRALEVVVSSGRSIFDFYRSVESSQLSVGIQENTVDNSQLTVGIQKNTVDISQLTVGIQENTVDSSQLTVGIQKNTVDILQLNVNSQPATVNCQPSTVNCQPPTVNRQQIKFSYKILSLSREELYSRINKRVDKMIEEGLEDEVRSLMAYKDLPALQTVGYKEFFEYFDGKCTREEAIDKIKQHTRNYAKRQVTWFKRNAVDG